MSLRKGEHLTPAGGADSLVVAGGVVGPLVPVAQLALDNDQVFDVDLRRVRPLTAGADGLLAGNAAQLGTQGIAVLASGVYAAALTFGILKAIDATIGLRVAENDEREGLDSTLHGEQGYAAGSAGSAPVGEAISEPAAIEPERVVLPVSA